MCVYILLTFLHILKPYVPQEIALLLFLRHCSHILYNRVSLFCLKKELVKAERFEPRIVQLRVRNLTDSANSFPETHQT